MELKIIQPNEDKTDALYASDDCQQLISVYEGYYPTIGFNIPWVGYFVIKENTVVGCCSFTSQPQDGKVEISYWTFAGFEGQGIATFSCKQLIAIAKKTDPGVIITAKTAPGHNASTKILQKNGFVFTMLVQDHEIGDAWLWVLAEGAR